MTIPKGATNAGFVLLRLPQVLEMIPVSKSSWWAGVASGKYPQSIKLGPRTTVWREHEILSFIESLSSEVA